MKIFLLAALFSASVCFAGEGAADIERAKAKAQRDLTEAQRKIAELDKKAENPAIKDQRFFLNSLRGSWTMAPVKTVDSFAENDTVYFFTKDLMCKFTAIRREAFKFTIVAKAGADSSNQTIRFSDGGELTISTNGLFATIKDKTSEMVLIKSNAVSREKELNEFADRALDEMTRK